MQHKVFLSAVKILSFVFLLTCPSTFFGQSKDGQDPKAKAILDDLSKHTKLFSTIKADFTVTIISKDKTKKPEVQKGSLQLKGDKYKLDIKGQEITSDGKTSWTFLKDNNEVQINDVDPKGNEGVSPTTIFTIYEKGYKFAFVTENATTQIIHLFPLSPDKKKFHTIKLEIDRVKKQISSFAVMMKDGSSMDYTLSSFITNTDMPDAKFTFDPKSHPGVEVVDLREH